MSRGAGRVVGYISTAVILGALVAAVDHLGFSFAGWLAYTCVLSLGGGVVWFAWRWATQEESPRWLVVALIAAIGLRLLVSVGLTHLLPRFGYDKPDRKQSFIYTDAYLRDRAAWALAVSDAPLTNAFEQRNQGDQYGGMAFLYATVYRLFRPAGHRPLLMVALGLPFSALLLLFTWAFTKSVFGPRPATFAAWVMAVYPDAILHGSSQMREPYLGAAFAMALFGYALIKRMQLSRGVVSIALGTLVVALPLSPPFTLAILFAVFLAWLWEGVGLSGRGWWVALILLAAAGIALLMLVNALSLTLGLSGSPVEILISWWTSTTDRWQIHELFLQSDWIRQLFRSTPDWAHLPLVVFYGLLRPFLPAAIIDEGAPIWRTIALWRGLGWWALIPFLVYAPLVVVRRTGLRSMPTYLAVLIWVVAFVASYRGLGDQWDNPRYRVIFLSAQAALAGWAWVSARERRDPWLSRTAIAVAGALALFTAWYYLRYGLLPYIGVMEAVAIVGGLVLLYLGGALVWDVLQARRKLS